MDCKYTSLKKLAGIDSWAQLWNSVVQVLAKKLTPQRFVIVVHRLLLLGFYFPAFINSLFAFSLTITGIKILLLIAVLPLWGFKHFSPWLPFTNIHQVAYWFCVDFGSTFVIVKPPFKVEIPYSLVCFAVLTVN